MDQQTIELVAQLSALNVVVTPALVAVAVQSRWRREIKTGVAVASCAASGLLAVLVAGHAWTDLVVALPVAVLATQKAYEHFWKKTGLAPALESATDLLAPRPVAT